MLTKERAIQILKDAKVLGNLTPIIDSENFSYEVNQTSNLHNFYGMDIPHSIFNPYIPFNRNRNVLYHGKIYTSKKDCKVWLININDTYEYGSLQDLEENITYLGGFIFLNSNNRLQQCKLISANQNNNVTFTHIIPAVPTFEIKVDTYSFPKHEATNMIALTLTASEIYFDFTGSVLIQYRLIQGNDFILSHLLDSHTGEIRYKIKTDMATNGFVNINITFINNGKLYIQYYIIRVNGTTVTLVDSVCQRIYEDKTIAAPANIIANLYSENLYFGNIENYSINFNGYKITT